MILILLDWFTFFRSFSPDHSFTKNIHSDSKPLSSKPEYYLFTFLHFSNFFEEKKVFNTELFWVAIVTYFWSTEEIHENFSTKIYLTCWCSANWGLVKRGLKYHIHATKKFEFSKYFCQSFIDRKFIKVVSLLHRHAKFVIDSKHITANMAHKWWAT